MANRYEKYLDEVKGAIAAARLTQWTAGIMAFIAISIRRQDEASAISGIWALMTLAFGLGKEEAESERMIREALDE